MPLRGTCWHKRLGFHLLHSVRLQSDTIDLSFQCLQRGGEEFAKANALLRPVTVR